MTNPFKAINWNRIQDQIDLMTWDKLHSQFWLPERINVAGDVKDWSNLSPEEKTLYNRVFGGLTMLDTLQSEEGAYIMQQHSRTQHEKAVWSQITMMEAIHARSYSTIFTTLCTPREIDEIFKWTEENEYVQKKAKLIQDVYRNGTPLQIKVAGVFLETFSFYSGFFTPLYYVGMGKMSNVAEIIKLIIRDESVLKFKFADLTK